MTGRSASNLDHPALVGRGRVDKAWFGREGVIDSDDLA